MSSQVRLQRGNGVTKEEIGVNTCEEAAAADSCAGRSLPYCLGTNRMVFFTTKTAIFCQKDPMAHKSCLFTHSLKSALIYSVHVGIYSAFHISYPV